MEIENSSLNTPSDKEVEDYMLFVNGNDNEQRMAMVAFIAGYQKGYNKGWCDGYEEGIYDGESK
jgi:hypothetical protein